jgi:hypothetical protein
MLQKALAFARENVILTAVQHALGGFGVALLLQWYIQDTAFAPAWLGWVFVAFSVAIHIYEVGLALIPTSTSTTRTTASRSFSATLP